MHLKNNLNIINDFNKIYKNVYDHKYKKTY